MRHSDQENPLLSTGAFPRFDLIQPVHVVPAMRHVLAELEQHLEQLERDAQPTWEGLVEPLERLGDRLSVTWGVVGHLMGVKNCEALREAYQDIQPEVVRFSLRLGQSAVIFKALNAIRASAACENLQPAQHRIIDALILDARLAGVGLEGRARQRFNDIEQELAELGTQFSNNVLDATKAFSLTLETPDDIAGLPPSLLEMTAQAARETGVENATAAQGPWRVTLDFPSFGPFMEHSQRRDLRETLYRAFMTRASSGEHDNTPLIERILRLRQEEAHLLGYDTYAALSLASKMAPDVEAIDRLSEELRQASFEAAQKDLDDIKTFARQQAAPEAETLCHWDIPYWAERLREHRYAFNDEELKPYFPLPRVLEGLFALTQRLFGVTIVADDGAVPVWHEDVRFFRIYGPEGDDIAAFFLDPYSRPAEKRGGAWMDECVGRSRLLAPPDAVVRLPVAYLICNQTPPVGEKPSLMTFTEVKTLFHEFGHGLQHMLTKVDYGMAAGISNVEWDAVELPSQFMENWCYHRETLMGLSGHVDTGEPLPQELFEKILAARNYRAGSQMLRQLYFGCMDIALHHGFDPQGEQSIFDVQREVAETTTVIPPLPEDKFLCSFDHIFAGGYAAGYYSYKWAEVLSADAFAAFEEAGLDNDDALSGIGRRYRDTILALGGSRHPMEVFKAFRGREPTTAALLRHSGLAA
jgi:oligopeptidase A